MKIRIIGCVAAVGLAALGLSTASCEQPENECSASRRFFAARLVLTSGDDSCRLFGPYVSEIVGIQTYNPATSEGTDPDVTKAFIAIKALNLQAIYHNALAGAYGVVDPDHELADDPDTAPTRFAYALGDFVDVLPDEEVCSVPQFRTVAEYSTPEAVPPVVCGGGGAGGGGGEMGGAGGAGGGGEMGGAGGAPECVDDPGIPKLDVRYAWSNFRMVERSDAPGTVWEASLSFAETAECAADYKVIAIAPNVDCGQYDHDTGEPIVDAEGVQLSDPSLCLPDADVEAGRPVGSGLNPALTDIIGCVGPDPVAGWQCAITVNSIDEVIAKLEGSE
jgi:hypothetical protein